MGMRYEVMKCAGTDTPTETAQRVLQHIVAAMIRWAREESKWGSSKRAATVREATIILLKSREELRIGDVPAAEGSG